MQPENIESDSWQDVVGINAIPGSINEHHRVLQEDGCTESRDDGGQPWGFTQGTIGDPVEQGSHHGHQAHNHQGKNHGAPEGADVVGECQRGQKSQSEVGSEGEHIAVSEIDQLQNAVYHGIAQGDQGVNGSYGQSIGQLLKKLFHQGVFAVRQ